MEEIVKRHPSIVDACAVSLPQLDCTELPVFALQRRNGDKVDTQEVAELLRSEYFLQPILYIESIISKTHSNTYVGTRSPVREKYLDDYPPQKKIRTRQYCVDI